VSNRKPAEQIESLFIIGELKNSLFREYRRCFEPATDCFGSGKILTHACAGGVTIKAPSIAVAYSRGFLIGTAEGILCGLRKVVTIRFTLGKQCRPRFLRSVVFRNRVGLKAAGLLDNRKSSLHNGMFQKAKSPFGRSCERMTGPSGWQRFPLRKGGSAIGAVSRGRKAKGAVSLSQFARQPQGGCATAGATGSSSLRDRRRCASHP
jgi:hypothetical protein